MDQLPYCPKHGSQNIKISLSLEKAQNDSLRIHKQHFSLLSEALNDARKVRLSKDLKNFLFPIRFLYCKAPKGLNCTMRQYQADGLNWLNFLQTAGLGGCLADDMGLGKTIQTLALLQYNKENMHPSQSLIKSVAEYESF